MHVKIRPKHSPNKAQEFMVFVIFVSFPAAFASETDGRSITQAQLQSTPGNKSTGRVRPEMVPNMSVRLSCRDRENIWEYFAGIMNIVFHGLRL